MNAFLTLIWMQWRKIRWLLFALLAGSTAACGVILVAARLGLHTDTVLALGYISAFLPIVIALGALLLIHSDADRVSLHLPHRILRLPVASWRVALALMLFGAAVVAGVAIFTTAILQFAFDAPLQWWLPAAISLLVLAALQVWQFAQRDPSPAGTVASLFVVLVPVAVLARTLFLGEASALGAAAGFLVLWLILFAAGAAALALNRRGGVPGLAGRDQRRAAGAVRLSQTRRFHSPLAAHSWYERKRFGWQLPALVIAVLTIYFFGMPLLTTLFTGEDGVPTNTPATTAATAAIDWLGNPQFIATGFQIAALLAGVAVGAYIFTRAGYWNAPTTYSLTLPATTRGLAFARVRVLFVSCLLALCIFGLVLALIAASMTARGEYFGFASYLTQAHHDTFPGWFGVAFFLGALALFMWVTAWPVNAGFVLATYAAVFVAVFGVAYVGRFTGMVAWSTEARESWTHVGTAVGSVVVTCAFLLVAYAAVRRGLVHPIAAIAAVLLWCVCGAAFYYWATAWEARPPSPSLNMPGRFRRMEGSTWPHPVDWGLWIGLSLLPIAPVVLHPYLLDRSRHR